MTFCKRPNFSPDTYTCLAPGVRARSRPIFGPTGQQSLAQGLPWETRSIVTSPEGAPGIPGRGSSSAGAPSGPQAIIPKPRVNPGLNIATLRAAEMHAKDILGPG